jgi:hypothetical protein
MKRQLPMIPDDLDTPSPKRGCFNYLSFRPRKIRRTSPLGFRFSMEGDAFVDTRQVDSCVLMPLLEGGVKQLPFKATSDNVLWGSTC